MQLSVENISKHFDYNYLFKNLSFSIESGNALVVEGANGSGKTTLLKIMAALQRASSGIVTYKMAGDVISREDIYHYIGYVAPYMELYGELSGIENIEFFAGLKGGEDYDRGYMNNLCGIFNLSSKLNIKYKAYSSGMKQRLKYIIALMNRPKVLFIDEPRTNLDNAGITAVYELLNEYKNKGLLIIATNEKEDLQFADMRIQIDK